jgi:bacteriorhodopsin
MPQRVLDLVHLDFAPQHRQPSGGRLVLATLVSIVGSLLADALLVVIAQAVAPSTRGYVHFQFGDYAKLTIVGVIIACIAWPITTRISSQPRQLFFLMAIAVTLVLWLPDVYILVQGQSAVAVAVLFLMHLAIALVTYNALVRLSPIGAQRQASAHRVRQAGR